MAELHAVSGTVLAFKARQTSLQKTAKPHKHDSQKPGLYIFRLPKSPYTLLTVIRNNDVIGCFIQSPYLIM